MSRTRLVFIILLLVLHLQAVMVVGESGVSGVDRNATIELSLFSPQGRYNVYVRWGDYLEIGSCNVTVSSNCTVNLTYPTGEIRQPINITVVADTGDTVFHAYLSPIATGYVVNTLEFNTYLNYTPTPILVISETLPTALVNLSIETLGGDNITVNGFSINNLPINFTSVKRDKELIVTLLEPVIVDPLVNINVSLSTGQLLLNIKREGDELSATGIIDAYNVSSAKVSLIIINKRMVMRLYMPRIEAPMPKTSSGTLYMFSISKKNLESYSISKPLKPKTRTITTKHKTENKTSFMDQLINGVSKVLEDKKTLITILIMLMGLLMAAVLLKMRRPFLAFTIMLLTIMLVMFFLYKNNMW